MTSGNPFSVFHKKLVFKISINMAAYKGPQSIDIFIKKFFIFFISSIPTMRQKIIC